jgi:hypothetical protein
MLPLVAAHVLQETLEHAATPPGHDVRSPGSVVQGTNAPQRAGMMVNRAAAVYASCTCRVICSLLSQ